MAQNEIETIEPIITRKQHKRWKNWLPAEETIMKENYSKKGGVGVKPYLPNKSLAQIYAYAKGHDMVAPKQESKAVGKKWTAKEVETLVKLFPDHTFKELSSEIGRSSTAIQKKAESLGLKKQEHKPFTEIEKEIIKRFYPYEGVEVMKRLPKDRSYNSVICYARLNQIRTAKLYSFQVDNVEFHVMLSMEKEGYTYSYIAKVTGYCTKTVRDKLKMLSQREKLMENSGVTWSESEEQTITATFDGGASMNEDADTTSRTERTISKDA